MPPRKPAMIPDLPVLEPDDADDLADLIARADDEDAPDVRDVLSLSDLIPDDLNANLGTERGREMVARSLTQYGAGRSILVDRHGRIIAGNKTVEGALAAGMTDVVIVRTKGDKLVVVQREDLDLHEDVAARELAVVDNRAGELGLAWDPAALEQLAELGVDLEQFWDADELGALLGSVAPDDEALDAHGDVEQAEDADAFVGRADEFQEKWGVRLGDVYEISSRTVRRGTHRLMCGDSRDRPMISRLLAGRQPRLMATDPPYGVKMDSSWRSEAGLNQQSWSPTPNDEMDILNDDIVDWREVYEAWGTPVLYVWHAGLFASEVAESMKAAGYQIRSQIVWVKPSLIISRGAYHWQHEPCWYAVKKGETANWTGDRKQSTTWMVSHLRPKQDSDDADTFRTGHASQKPVELFRIPIRNHTEPGDTVAEAFVGSGSQFIAAELEGRLCVGMELDPKFVAATLERLTVMGLEPRLVHREPQPEPAPEVDAANS